MSNVRYTRTAIALHWLLALLLVLNVALALSVEAWPDEWVRPVIDTHKSIGITALGLVLLRILWRATHRPPPLPSHYRRGQRLAASTAHGLLYLVMLALPLSGWLHDSAWRDAASHPMQLFGLVAWPRVGFVEALPPLLKERWHDRLGALHTWFGYALYGLLVLHVAAALKHQWFDRERELQRMWF